MILATITLFLGFFQTSIEHFLTGNAGRLAAAAHGAAQGAREAAHEGHGAGHYVLLVFAVCMALGGLGWAWVEFGRKKAAQVGFLGRFPRMWDLFAERWYLDRLYRRFLDRGIYAGITSLFTRNDRRVIDGGIDGLCFFTVTGGRLFSFLQSGMLQYNLLVMIGGVGIVVLLFLV